MTDGCISAALTRPGSIASFVPALVFLLHILGQVVNQFIQGEDAEADFVVGCFRAALEQAGESHSWRRPRGGC